MNMKKLLFTLTFFCYGILLIAQENKLPVFITDSLENYITKGMKDWEIPGLSVGIIQNGKVVFLKGYGVTKIGGKTPVDENTLFMIGSNTKAFTGLAIAMLQEDGKLSLNDKVQKWMPEFKLKNALASNEVIIADLLSHRIGFETFQGDFTYWTTNLTRAEVIQKMSLIDGLYNFRTKYGYCNAAFLTAGELIPRVIGKSWEAMVKDSILIPLKMNRTLMLSNELNSATNKALPHTLYDNKIIEIPIPEINNLAPAASMSSSASDMLHWLSTLLDNGKYEGKQVISDRAVMAIRQPYSIVSVDPRDNRESHFRLYGLGLAIGDVGGKMVYSHTGGVDGFVTSTMFIPEAKLGIVVLTNTDHNRFFQALTYEIRDAFLNLPYKGYSSRSLKQSTADNEKYNAKLDSLRKMVKLNNKTSLALQNFTGKYVSEVYGEIEVKLENQKLNIYLSHHPNMIGKLEHIENNNFLCTYTNPTMGIVEIPFKITDGKVTGLTLSCADFVEFTVYEFKKM